MKDKKELLSNAERIEKLERELQHARQELDHIVSAMPGGVAVYRYVDNRFVTESFSDGVPALTGHSRAEYEEIIKGDALNIVYHADKARLAAIAFHAMSMRLNTQISYRISHKSGKAVWVHLNMKFIEDDSDDIKIYAVFSGMSKDSKLYQSIANDSSDGIYVIDKTDFELFYVNESVKLFIDEGVDVVGEKCYKALHGRNEQCEFCPLRENAADNEVHTVVVPENGRIYSMRFRETDWYGIPSYVKNVSDVTEVTGVRRQKAQLEQYFRIMIQNLAGGVAVCFYDEKRNMLLPEFMSDGFAAMCGMTVEEAWEIYRDDAAMGVHPDDAPRVVSVLLSKISAKSDDTFTLTYRLRHKDGTYFWVKNNTTFLYADEQSRTYSIYTDITDELEEQEKSKVFYNEMILRHHRSADPNLLLSGHCNITQEIIVKITDNNGYDVEYCSGKDRDTFFRAFAEFIEGDREKKEFLDTFLTAPMLKLFNNGTVKCEMECFVKFPKEIIRRYVRISVNIVMSPDSGDITGMLSVVDRSDQRISDLILFNLIKNDYDFIAILDLASCEYSMLSYNEQSKLMPDRKGFYDDQVKRFLNHYVVPRDRAECETKMNLDYIKDTLDEKNSYSFHYAVKDDHSTYDKSMIIFYIDKRLNKVCLARTDITESVSEQHKLLNALAYVFEIVSFIDVQTGMITVHERSSLLGNMPPKIFENYDQHAVFFADKFGTEQSKSEMLEQFKVKKMLSRLEKSPQGYEYSFACYPFDGKSRNKEDICYKQGSILWGDSSHRTICMVCADVTDTFRKERETKEQLSNALMLAREANRAKTDFLSSMSHDIRTPMNAIIGMTDLALSDRKNPLQIDESLAIIKSSSELLLRLINEILDMSRIESGQLTLAREPFSHKTEFEKFVANANALAEKKKIKLLHNFDVEHDSCMGDAMRLHQIFNNIVGNAIKFTPSGGTVTLKVEEFACKSPNIGLYRFVISDTGIGIDEESRKRIFEPFFRAENNAVRNIEGTGLGLSIVKNILDYQGGTINVESEQGKGSCFTIELPFHFAEAQVAHNQKVNYDDDVSCLLGKHVLLVEDNPINSLVATKILERVGIVVDSAENGKEGVEKFAASEKNTYDAIFMDIQMPIMNGYEAVREIRASEHPRAKSIPIIAMTANAFNSDVKSCMEAGMNAHVSKPIDTDKLYHILRVFVGGM